MHGLNQDAIAELEELRVSNSGFLNPEHVVERARSENSALHRYFEWDDTEAAQAYRIQQARQVVRAVVRFLPAANRAPFAVRAYLSLTSDRAAGLGYRATAEILDDDARAAEALRQLERDVLALEAKYAAFATLRPALAAMVASIPRPFVGTAEATLDPARHAGA